MFCYALSDILANGIRLFEVYSRERTRYIVISTFFIYSNIQPPYVLAIAEIALA